jgi:hypothetical protein
MSSVAAHIIEHQNVSVSPIRLDPIEMHHEFIEKQLDAILVIIPVHELEKSDAI